MNAASALSVEADSSRALDQVLETLGPQLEGAHADLAVLFVSPEHDSRHEALVATLREALDPGCLIGCTAQGVLGGGREVESGPSLSVLAAALPGATLAPFHVSAETLPGPDVGPGAWVEAIGLPADRRQDVILLGDPSSTPEGLLPGLDFVYQGTKVGGLASAARGNSLFLNGGRHRVGMVGVGISGAAAIDPLVSQGCRPLGEPVVITGCRQNLLLELDGRRPTEVLAEIYSSLDERGRILLERSLHLGVASSGLGQSEPEFLIRNVIGVDPLRGLLAVGAVLRKGQTVQFHVRDALAATEDLNATLERYRAPSPPGAALLFACAGRGEGLFGEPDHDSQAFADRFGAIPIGGMFCAGEIGPVGSDTCLLGYTSSFGVLRAATPDA